MEKKLIAIDLDGTTLNNNSELTQETIDTLHAVKNLGHEVAIVTGRPYRNSKQYYDQLNLGGPIANFNGALCHIPGMPEWDGKYHITLDSEFVLDLVAFNKTLPVDYLMVEGTELVYSDMEELPECPYYPKDQKPIVIDKNTKLKEQPTAVALFSDVDKQPEIKSKILDRYDNDIEIRTWGGSFPCLEVISPGIHKAKALEHLSRYYGIKQENILAFGDEFGEDVVRYLGLDHIRFRLGGFLGYGFRFWFWFHVRFCRCSFFEQATSFGLRQVFAEFLNEQGVLLIGNADVGVAFDLETLPAQIVDNRLQADIQVLQYFVQFNRHISLPRVVISDLILLFFVGVVFLKHFWGVVVRFFVGVVFFRFIFCRRLVRFVGGFSGLFVDGFGCVGCVNGMFVDGLFLFRSIIGGCRLSFVFKLG